MGLSLYYQYPVTAFKIDKHYNTDNCAFEAYHKIEDELSDICYSKYRVNEFDEKKSSSVIYRGINCLYGLEKMIKKEISGEMFSVDFRGMSSATKKLYEHQKMILHSMNYLFNKWEDVMCEHAVQCILDYEECIHTIEKWNFLMMKYECTGEKRLLEKVTAEITYIYEREKQILDKFLHSSIKWEIFNMYFI